MYNYAVLNEDNIVIGLSEITNIIEMPNMILLSDEECKTVKLRSQYIDGKFIVPTPVESTYSHFEPSEFNSKIDELESKIDKLATMIEMLAN